MTAFFISLTLWLAANWTDPMTTLISVALWLAAAGPSMLLVVSFQVPAA